MVEKTAALLTSPSTPPKRSTACAARSARSPTVRRRPGPAAPARRRRRWRRPPARRPGRPGRRRRRWPLRRRSVSRRPARCRAGPGDDHRLARHPSHARASRVVCRGCARREYSHARTIGRGRLDGASRRGSDARMKRGNVSVRWRQWPAVESGSSRSAHPRTARHRKGSESRRAGRDPTSYRRSALQCATMAVPSALIGRVYLGQTIPPVADSLSVHLWRRVLIDQQWVPGTTHAEYLDDLRHSVREPGARLAIYLLRQSPQAVVIGPTSIPGAAPWSESGRMGRRSLLGEWWYAHVWIPGT